ncbi:MAG TPA: zinc-ribbon domain-containing protein [Planctomycetes bacterium]|nr:zinc-ribbon domain-containing protein [Planctomycetota bacterium]
MNRVACLPIVMSALFAGCQSTSESAGRNDLAAHVGIYSPPPAGIDRPRVGVPPMQVGSSASAGMEELAADQLATLLVATDRFEVIERSQLAKLLDEQDLEGIVEQGQLARTAAVRGVDYLLIGRITNLRTKATKTGSKSGFGKILSITTERFSGGVGGVDIDSKKVEMKVECGVDLRLVDPSTGTVLDAAFSEYTRTDKASSFGIQVLGVGSDANAEIEMSDDDRGLILRLACDEAVRKMLPSLDRKLRARTRALAEEAAASSGETAGAAVQATEEDGNSEAAAALFCSKCGAKAKPGAAFCASCGAKLGA